MFRYTDDQGPKLGRNLEITLFSFTNKMTSFLTSRYVAVIGAGAAGLVAARELSREGHVVVVFERQDQVGGTWIYREEVDSDPLGLDPDRSVVHSSLYDSLRTNLSREVMGFLDYPFVSKHGESGDPRRFPGHGEVLRYLKDFATEFAIEKMVRFETEVVSVGLQENGKWRVKSKERGEHVLEEIFDAVVVCNGHNTEPHVADIPGVEAWPGKQIHSHNYRLPQPFQDQVVIVIGSSFSAVDISRDLAGIAKEVHVASRSVPGGTYEKQPGYDNMWFHSMIERANEDGSIIFQNDKVVVADTIVHCTGYKYHFPFLETNGKVNVDDNRVGPLYKHVFPPALAPCLSFVGLPLKVIPFVMCELQSKWIAAILSGRIALPPMEEMMKDIEAFYLRLKSSGTPNCYTHDLFHSQFEYYNWIAAQCGCSGFEEWRKLKHDDVSINRLARPDEYRDVWDDQHLVLQAGGDSERTTEDKA
ncbi:hypothetical protein PTKIN_Ptkin04bG0204700 [Pterospermum kingtungense]